MKQSITVRKPRAMWPASISALIAASGESQRKMTDAIACHMSGNTDSGGCIPAATAMSSHAEGGSQS